MTVALRTTNVGQHSVIMEDALVEMVLLQEMMLTVVVRI